MGSFLGGTEAVGDTHRFPHKGGPLVEPISTNFEPLEHRTSGSGGGNSLSMAQAGSVADISPTSTNCLDTLFSPLGMSCG